MPEKLRLDIPILLPDVIDAADACVTRLMAELHGRDGVQSVHVRAPADGAAAQLCVHYDASILPLPRIRELVASAGAKVTERYGHILSQLEISHQRRARTIAATLRDLPGVLEAPTRAVSLALIAN